MVFTILEILSSFLHNFMLFSPSYSRRTHKLHVYRQCTYINIALELITHMLCLNFGYYTNVVNIKTPNSE